MANIKRERDYDNEEEEGNIRLCVCFYLDQFQVSSQVNVASMLTNKRASFRG